MFWNRVEKRDAQSMTLDEFTNFLKSNSGLLETDAMKESTYFKCIKKISEGIAIAPIMLKKDTDKGEIEATEHKLFNTLRLRPNLNMSAVDCVKAFVALGEHKGISGLYIDRKTMQLYPVEIEMIVVDDVGLIQSTKQNKIMVKFNLIWNNGLYRGECFEKDIILYRGGMSFNGIDTHATKDYLQQTISTSQKAQNYLGSLFDNGLTNKVIVQLISEIKEKDELTKIQNKFNKMYSNNGRVFTVPAGYNVSALNLSLADAQFEQLRKLTRREIANCFGLSPADIGDLEDSNNNNMEMQNISFLVNTLNIKFQQIEQELDWKLLTDKERKQGYKFRFNTNVMLRTNAKEQADIITNYVRNGVYTINDARRILGFSFIDGGDEPLLSSGTYKLSQLDDIIASKTINKLKSNSEGGENNNGEGN